MRRRETAARWPRVERPTDEENWELIRRAQAGDREARDECVSRNTPMVIRMAAGFGLGEHDTDDLIQQGLIGLDVAIMGFDLSLRTKLSTHACPRIRQKMLEWRYDHSRDVRIPRWHQQPAATAKAGARVRKGEARTRHHGTIMARSAVASAPAASIYEVGRETGMSLAELLPARDEGEDASEDIAAMLAAMRDHLGPRAASVLHRRYWCGHKLAEIAADMGITKQGVNQIERTSLERLRRILTRETA
jgi:RNA polymerase sporulation-specific sigma factor